MQIFKRGGGRPATSQAGTRTIDGYPQLQGSSSSSWGTFDFSSTDGGGFPAGFLVGQKMETEKKNTYFLLPSSALPLFPPSCFSGFRRIGRVYSPKNETAPF